MRLVCGRCLNVRRGVYAQRVKPERLQFTRFTPLVGSPLADFKPLGSLGFHARGEDPVGRWIARAYEACRDPGWGRESW